MCVCTHAHESASTRVLLGRTLRHLRTFIFNPGETQSCRGPPAPSARPWSHACGCPLARGRCHSRPTPAMEDAARCCSRDRGPRRGRGERARPLAARALRGHHAGARVRFRPGRLCRSPAPLLPPVRKPFPGGEIMQSDVRAPRRVRPRCPPAALRPSRRAC